MNPNFLDFSFILFTLSGFKRRLWKFCDFPWIRNTSFSLSNILTVLLFLFLQRTSPWVRSGCSNFAIFDTSYCTVFVWFSKIVWYSSKHWPTSKWSSSKKNPVKSLCLCGSNSSSLAKCSFLICFLTWPILSVFWQLISKVSPKRKQKQCYT